MALQPQLMEVHVCTTCYDRAEVLVRRHCRQPRQNILPLHGASLIFHSSRWIVEQCSKKVALITPTLLMILLPCRVLPLPETSSTACPPEREMHHLPDPVSVRKWISPHCRHTTRGSWTRPNSTASINGCDFEGVK